MGGEGWVWNAADQWRWVAYYWFCPWGRVRERDYPLKGKSREKTPLHEKSRIFSLDAWLITSTISFLSPVSHPLYHYSSFSVSYCCWSEPVTLRGVGSMSRRPIRIKVDKVFHALIVKEVSDDFVLPTWQVTCRPYDLRATDAHLICNKDWVPSFLNSFLINPSCW